MIPLIPLMKNTFVNEVETKKRLAEFIISSEKLTMGKKCAQFEYDFSTIQGRRNGILFNRGGSANLALLQSLKNLGKLRDGSRIGFSALTWSTNVMPIIQLGMIPVAVDCKISTLNVMSENLLDILDNTKIDAFFITNVLGFSGDLDRIREICNSENILLIEDNCEALGTVISNNKTGKFGLASSFSFFVAHHMSTIEGGMICTDDEELEEMLRVVRANGWDRNLTNNQQKTLRQKHNVASEFEAKYTFYDLGFNLRPTEITGFLGSLQLEYLVDNITKRNLNHIELSKVIAQNPDLILIDNSQIEFLSPFAFPVVCKTAELMNLYRAKFFNSGIEVRPMIAGNIQHQPFFRKYVQNSKSCPGADFLTWNSFYCGNYPELLSKDLKLIKKCIDKI